MTEKWALPVLSIALIGMAACEASERASEPTGVTISDSAGVTLIMNVQPERRLFLEEESRIGVIEGDPDYILDRVRALALDGSGGVWIVDSHESVRHYDRSGEYVGAVGGKGEGPGEAQGYANVWLGDPGVLVFGYPAILQFFGKDGAFLGSRPARDGRQSILPLGFAQDQWTITIPTFPDELGDLFRRKVSIARIPELTSDLDPLASFPGRLFRLAGPGHVAAGPFFLGNPAFGMDGSGRIFVSDTLEYRVAVYDPNGSLDRVITRAATPTSFEPDWLSEIEEGIWATLRRDGLPSNADPQVAEMMKGAVPPTPPEHLPFIEDLLVARDGSFWLERADRHPTPAVTAVAHAFGWVRHAWPQEWVAPLVFDVFRANGEYRGTVELDALFEPMAVTPDGVTGVRFDELNVETVVAYRLVQAG